MSFLISESVMLTLLIFYLCLLCAGIYFNRCICSEVRFKESTSSYTFPTNDILRRLGILGRTPIPVLREMLNVMRRCRVFYFSFSSTNPKKTSSIGSSDYCKDSFPCDIVYVLHGALYYLSHLCHNVTIIPENSMQYAIIQLVQALLLSNYNLNYTVRFSS
jgi:hypothetical protein